MYIDKLKPYEGGILLLCSSKFINIFLPFLVGAGFFGAAFIPNPDLSLIWRFILIAISVPAFWMMFRGIKQIKMFGGQRFAIISSKGIEIFSGNRINRIIPWQNISGISFISSVNIITSEEMSFGKDYVFIWINKPLGLRGELFFESPGFIIKLPQTSSLGSINARSYIFFSIDLSLKDKLFSWIRSFSNDKIYIEECEHISIDFPKEKLKKENCKNWIG